MHLPLLITDLAYILGVAAVVTLLFRRIRQPVVLGYIIAGVIVGPHMPGPNIAETKDIEVWAELGVIFLMFALGLEFSFRRLLSVGFRLRSWESFRLSQCLAWVMAPLGHFLGLTKRACFLAEWLPSRQQRSLLKFLMN